MQFFSSPMARSSEHVLVTIELLNLVAKVIESPKCIFVRKKKYIDFYIGYVRLPIIHRSVRISTQVQLKIGRAHV